MSSRRSLSIHEGDSLGFLPEDEFAHLIIAECLAPGLLKADDGCALPLAHFCLTITEKSVCEDHDLRAGLHKVRYCRFHTARPCCRNCQREGIRGAVAFLQHVANFSADFEKVRVE